MGGSGGGGYFFEPSKKPEEIAQKIREEEVKATSALFETEVSNLLRQLLSNVNNRDVETIQDHLSTIEDALHTDIDGTIDLRYGGSVSKHTYVDGLSDIDSLAILNNSELANLSPDDVKQYFFEKLRERLPDAEITIGNLAVTLKFPTGVELQLLPALKDKQGIRIPSSRRENSWSHLIRPDVFAKILRYTNAKMNGKLVPTVKLSKSIISSFPEQRKLAGYHTECMAIEIFSKYHGEGIIELC